MVKLQSNGQEVSHFKNQGNQKRVSGGKQSGEGPKEGQGLRTPHPPKSCRFRSCDDHADEAFLVLWASTNNQWGKKTPR
ncbi:hypothetical protein PBF_03230 [Cytobacillus firmus DS1]|uniref:Uncharacterized protein n=1 Tax=Cytobacillus firmus DS1 TaxID=1307436 RepID=W7KYX2_CYTFI|nr:hypothetical protein PBF_03230 [Cytobacillus firmus DS1]